MYIREYRKRNNLTQTELADKIGVHENTLRRWENGDFEPRSNDLQKLAEALGCTEAELLNGPNENKIKISLSYDWENYEKGEINMTGNEFDIFLGRDGEIGLKGAGKLTTREAVEDFLSHVRLQVEAGFEAQIKRGAIQLA